MSRRFRGRFATSRQGGGSVTLLPNEAQRTAIVERGKISKKLHQYANANYELPKLGISPCIHAAEGCKGRGIYMVSGRIGKWCSDHRDEATQLQREWQKKRYGN